MDGWIGGGMGGWICRPVLTEQIMCRAPGPSSVRLTGCGGGTGSHAFLHSPALISELKESH
jgi:hypothetical protein